jgi:hypothetical protein
MKFGHALFLPEAAQRNAADGTKTTGDEGFYWSSNSDTSNLSYSFQLSNSNFIMGTTLNNFGNSVRCIEYSKGF